MLKQLLSVIVSPDTNLFVRILVNDDPEQVQAAAAALDNADQIIVSSTVLCEVAWVLKRMYRLPSDEIADAIEKLLGSYRLNCDRLAIEGGLASIRAGAGFADGVVATEAARAGARFLSFDRRAVRALQSLGIDAATPGV